MKMLQYTYYRVSSIWVLASILLIICYFDNSVVCTTIKLTKTPLTSLLYKTPSINYDEFVNLPSNIYTDISTQKSTDKNNLYKFSSQEFFKDSQPPPSSPLTHTLSSPHANTQNNNKSDNSIFSNPFLISSKQRCVNTNTSPLAMFSPPLSSNEDSNSTNVEKQRNMWEYLNNNTTRQSIPSEISKTGKWGYSMGGYTSGKRDIMKRRGISSSLLYNSKKRRRKESIVWKASSRMKILLKKIFTNPLFDPYKSIPIITRCLLTGAIGLSLMHTCFSLDPANIALHGGNFLYSLQLYRPITAMLFFGPLSLPMLSRLYLWYTNSKQLEETHGSAQHLLFITTQLTILTIFSLLFEQPFYSSALSSSTLYQLSKLTPFSSVRTLFSIPIPLWQLPFVSILIDVLNAQNSKAAIPGILGIFSSHIYYFLHDILPQMGGTQFFEAPRPLYDMLDVTNEAN